MLNVEELEIERSTFNIQPGNPLAPDNQIIRLAKQLPAPSQRWLRFVLDSVVFRHPLPTQLLAHDWLCKT